MELRDYQKEIIEKCRVAFASDYKRPLVVLPCGAGKTVCFIYMALRHKGNVAFLVHRKELVDQTIKAFGGDLPPNIYVGMIRSKLPFEPTLLIIDECHHATAKTYLDVISKYPNAYMVGLTATPCRLDGSALGQVFDTLIVDVDTKWLIDNHYLAPYEYYAPPQQIMLPKMRYGDFAVGEMEYESCIYGDIKKYISGKTIIYCPNIRFSRALAIELGGEHIDGDTPKKERERITSEFRNGDIDILCNVDLLGEGYDVPACDTVILLRPTMSVALYIQQAMRCMRYVEGKVAKIYDMVGNVHRHGLIDEPREWTLTGKIKCKGTGEPDIIVRLCKSCFRVYAGNSRVCPYCNATQPLTEREIKQLKEIELEQIKKTERRKQGMAKSYEQLVAIGKTRGYKNPQYWAKCILKSRSKNDI